MFRFWNSVLRPAFEALRPRSIMEIGIGEGSHTVLIGEYAAQHGCMLTIIDPFPRTDVPGLERRFPGVIVPRLQKSLDAIPLLPPADVVLIDGDHNWHTVLSELRALRDLAARHDRAFPVVFLHDVGWPYGRRDMYAAPADIPDASRQPYAVGGVLPSMDALSSSDGFNVRMVHAKTEGGPRNGVRTAVDDFLAEAPDMRYVEFDGFHGLGILYPSVAAEASGFRTFLASFQRTREVNVLLGDLEKDRAAQEVRVQHLRRALFHEHFGRLQQQKLIDRLEQDVAFLQGKIGHILHTLSWKITAPLRRAGELSREIRSFKGWVRLMRSCWKRIGSPFPAAARFVRHRILGRMVPAIPSREEALSTLAENVLRIYGGAPSVSVIVAARNNGPFLSECLRSILDQNIPPYEVIYADDGSTDNSVSIARSIPGVRVFAWNHQGVVKTRNAAVKESTGSLLLHVDGDDVLTPGYIAEQLAALVNHPDAVFAYGGARWFGAEASYYDPPEWDLERLWKENFINTSSIIRRSAFEAAGGWQEGVGTLWDWDLWLRVARIGRGVRSSSMLGYRRHEGSWSNISRGMDDHDTGKLMGRVRRSVANVSVCCIFGGRVPELLPLWMESLAASIRVHVDTANPPELIVLDHSCKHMDRIRALAEQTGVFRSVLVAPYAERFSWTEEMERRHKVAMFLAKAYNRLLALASGEIVWFLEDDVVVPKHAYDTLLRGLTDGPEPVAAVSGLYHSRHHDDWIANRVDAQGNVLSVDVSSGQPMTIDLAGTGCTMALRPLVPYSFQSHWRGSAPAHDWTWSEQIRRDGKQIVLYPSVRCRHYTDTERFI